MKNSAFYEEAAILEAARALLDAPEGQDWPSRYRELAEDYERLLSVSQRLVSVSDIIERRLQKALATIARQTAELEEKVQEFEAIFGNSDIGIAMARPDGGLARINERLCELLERPEEELTGRRIEDIGLKPSGEASPFLLSPQDGRAAPEVRYRSPSGRQAWFALHGRAIKPGSRQGGAIWTLADITGRKELEAVREDVERIMRHDLKSPLNGIINFPDLVRAAGPMNAEQEMYLGLIVEQGWVMLRQIELSLDLYKIETGAYVFNPQPVDMEGLVRQSARNLANLASALDVRLVLRLTAGASAARGDDLLCRCLVANVLKNAIEAAPRSGEVSVDLACGPDRLLLTVRNAGEVPESLRERFFDKYTTHNKTRGTGLGTYSSRLMARAMGGELTLDLSTPGQVALVLALDRA
jgi:PAS domain S-box-containing protein